MALISVIIPAYRAELFISRAVASVLAQTMQDFEIVIGSDDEQDYLAILEQQGIKDARLRCAFTGGVRTGSARARNCARAAATGRIIACLDSDDMLMPFHLERMLPLALQHGVVITQVSYAEHDSATPLPNRAKPYADGLLALEEILLACLHTYNPIMFDSKKIQHGWQESVPLLVDAVFLAQCYNAIPAVWYASDPSYCYFRRGDSVCNNANAAQRFLAAGRIILSLLDSGVLTQNPHIARVIRSYIARNDALELAFEKADARGEITDYQDFLGKNLTLLHTPLL